MNLNWSRGTRPEEPGISETGETAERYYMNKAFGRSLERAKALDGEMGKSQERDGQIQKATIEPDARGGHLVTIERLIEATGNGREARQSRVWFPEIESAIQFLRHVLSGKRPEDGQVGERENGEAEKNVLPLDERGATGALRKGSARGAAGTADDLA